MPDEMDIDELKADLQRAVAAPETPAWVGVLLRTVLMLVSAMQKNFDALNERLARLSGENKALRRQLYGKKSEKRPKSRLNTKRKPSSSAKKDAEKLDGIQLDEQTVEHEVAEKDRVCSACGKPRFSTMNAPEESVEYRYIPAKLVRVRHRRHKESCACGCTIVTAPVPPKVTPGGRFGAGLYADIIAKRCLDAIPFQRQADIWQRAGVPLSASTICDLFHRGADVLKELYRIATKAVRDSAVVHADETPQPVLDIGKTRHAYVWTFVTRTLAVFVHSASRSGATPQKVLNSSVGVLVADAYSGYNKVTGPDERTRAGCIVHCRRKFLDAEEHSPDEAAWIVDRIAELYAVEDEAVDRDIVGTADHLKLRRTRSTPIMNRIREWLTEQRAIARPTSTLAKAVNYMHNQWDTLTVFLRDPAVSPDNNAAERPLRRIALGRKNSLFVGYDQSGQRHAINMSFVASCRLNNIDPAVYLKDVLIRAQGSNDQQMRELLPDRWTPPA